jgi:hypothetical protein
MDNVPASRAVERQHSRSRWVLIGFLAVAAFFLLSEHRAHFLGILPYLLVLACPLMHFFHHGHHGHKGSGRTTAETGVPSEKPASPAEKS